jgi:mono/diheme cytochrome c family protein
MADKETEEKKSTDIMDLSSAKISTDPATEADASGGEVGHDDHSGFHTYSGGVIIERGDKPIDPKIWATYGVVILVIILGLAFGGYMHQPADTSDQKVSQISQTMSQQAQYVAMLSPYNIDMYELQLPKGQNLTQAISKGQDIYQSYCIGCHGPNQDGAGPNAVSLNPSPRNLRDQPFMQGLSYQRIWTSIHKGVPGTAMPRWENTLNDDQIRDVISYVFSLTAPTDPKSGQFERPSHQDLDAAQSPSVTQ